MGNINSNVGNANRHRRQNSSRRSHPPPPPQTPPPPPPSNQPPPSPLPNRYVFAAATPYPAPYANPGGYYQYQHFGYYPAPPPPPQQAGFPMPLPVPYDHHHQQGGGGNWGGATGRYPCGPMMNPPAPYVEHQKAVTIRNDVNIKKETLRVESDEENPGKFLVAFTFDATVAGSITIIFFAKEGEDCKLTPTKESLLSPVVVHFEQGLGQTFKQPSGSGIDFSMFTESELFREGDVDVYPLAVKADASPATNQPGNDGPLVPGSTNSQITQAIFDKEKGEYKVKVLKQILWVNGMRYELQEIYGIGNSVEGDFDGGNDPGKECVICLSEPRDTTVLPCRHMCMCSGCAKVLRFQTNRCPICRQPVERLLEIKVNNASEEERTT